MSPNCGTEGCLGLCHPRCALRAPDERQELADEWRNHIPSGYTDQAGYGQVHCSCGWDSSDVLGWEQHINAAKEKPG